MPKAPADCLRCGACCFSELPTYVRVTGDDYERLGDADAHRVRFEGNKAYMVMEEGHCAALTLEDDGTYVCGVYPTRPQTCRDLDRLSTACEGEIEMKGERPLIAFGKQQADRQKDPPVLGPKPKTKTRLA